MWQPDVGSSIQMILSGTVNPSAALAPSNVDIFDIDLFNTPASTISMLKSQGIKVMCYFSAGTSEDWRPDWSSFQESDKGACLPEWPGERWLNVRSQSVFDIMAKRIKLASDKGCDAIDPDNMDGYGNQNGGGFSLTTNDAISYTRRLAAEAAKYNLAMGLKNAIEIIPSVTNTVQFAVNEQCVENSGDCEAYAGFGKPVYHVEYVSSRSVSSGTLRKNCANKAFSTITKLMSLDGWVTYCDGSSASTSILQTAEGGGVECGGLGKVNPKLAQVGTA
ncbi:hypothetical protein EJ06DRAFT_484531 [Trichodelitschia bisporula]|uniref:alpha-galactosidase n=1 Tax=Trichodelitschia bisporula TaxID=703511 RepID=A0A6G1HJ11_9PEZI|nr:hypothetical protein EJ06DRAFT_484531 [Trichodelitschia bisporula]